MKNIRIGDTHVRDAIETIIVELENAEAMIATLQNDLANADARNDTLAAENDRLLQDIEELHSEVKRLDDALADTYIAQLDPKAPTRES